MNDRPDVHIVLMSEGVGVGGQGGGARRRLIAQTYLTASTPAQRAQARDNLITSFRREAEHLHEQASALHYNAPRDERFEWPPGPPTTFPSARSCFGIALVALLALLLLTALP